MTLATPPAAMANWPGGNGHPAGWPLLCVWGDALDKGDDLAEFAIDFLLSGRGSARALTRELAIRWPNHPALEYVLVLSLAANGIESTLSGEQADRLAHETWQMAALLGVDLYDAQALGLPHRTGADLMRYWQAHDRFFLNG